MDHKIIDMDQRYAHNYTIWTIYLHLTKENVDEEMLCKWKNKCSKALSLGYLFQWFYLC